VKLLSFGADEDAGEDDEAVVFKKKSIVRPDCTFTTSTFYIYITLISILNIVVENPRAVVAVPDFVSQPSASKSLNVAKEITIEPKVHNFLLFLSM
jgi:peptidyl-prolyl cis-trans isomerase SDCCAG10